MLVSGIQQINSVIYIFQTIFHHATSAKSLQLCPTLCDPIDGSPPGSPVLGILQARILEWVAISFPWGIFLTQGSNLHLLYLQEESLPLSYLGSLKYRIATFKTILLLSRFSHAWLCATPQMAAHQAPLSLGFFRQEYQSGLQFLSPMRESEKWKWSCSVCLTLSDLMDCSLPGSSVHGIFQARVLEWDVIAFS